MPDSKYFKIAVWVLLVFLIILVGTQIAFIFTPLVVLVNTLFFPVFLSGVLYFLTRPVVNFLNKHKVPRVLAVFIVFLVILGLLTVLALSVGPVIQHQFTTLIDNIPVFINTIERELIALEENEYIENLIASDFVSLENQVEHLTELLDQAFVAVGENISSFVGAVANVVVILIMIPFFLFYMLKDGQGIPEQLLRFLPKEHIDDGRRILGDMDKALSTYIQSLLFVSFCVGVMVFIGFSIVGLDYALLLSLFAIVTNVIPYIGPFIGAVPAVLVAMVDSPFMVFKVVIVVVIAQQIESSFISPQVMGKNLSIHPLVIITLLLAAGRFAGFLGMILAVPTYAILRVVVVNVYLLYQLHSKRKSLGSQ